MIAPRLSSTASGASMLRTPTNVKRPRARTAPWPESQRPHMPATTIPPNGTAEPHVHEISDKTRKQYSSEEKIRIVILGLRGEWPEPVNFPR